MTTVIWPHRDKPLDFTPSTTPTTTPARILTGQRRIRIVMAGGGTGGHLYPGLAVAEALQDILGNQLELIWAATPRPVDQRLLGNFGDRYVRQEVRPLVKKISKLWEFYRGWQKSCSYWRRYFADHQVDAVLALGGYAAGPASHVAAQRHIPVGLLNPDALPGLANRFLLRKAQRVFTQWELPGTSSIRGQVMPLGCPIRASLLGRSREEGAKLLGLDPSRPVLAITGGSLAAKNINDALITLLRDEEWGKALLDGRWQVLHLSGSEQLADVKAAYEPIKSLAHKVCDYCDDMASVYAVADLVIARAGASTCAELTACGVPAVLLPYPYHRDQHQKHNAARLVDAGCAILIDDRKDAAVNAKAIKAALISLLYDQSARTQMAAKARSVGKPQAARRIAEELLALLPA